MKYLFRNCVTWPDWVDVEILVTSFTLAVDRATLDAWKLLRKDAPTNGYAAGYGKNLRITQERMSEAERRFNDRR